MTPASQISPELVLVCPELAARARAAMPDRPWESFVPPRNELVATPVPVASERTKPPRWLRVVSLVPAALLAVFAALLLVGSVASFGERPSLAPASRHSDGSDAASSGAGSTAATWPTRPSERTRQPANARP